MSLTLDTPVKCPIQLPMDGSPRSCPYGSLRFDSLKKGNIVTCRHKAVKQEWIAMAELNYGKSCVGDESKIFCKWLPTLPLPILTATLALRPVAMSLLTDFV